MTGTTCECGNGRVRWMATVTLLNASDNETQVTIPVCHKCQKHFSNGEIAPARIILEMSTGEYYAILDHIAASAEVARSVLGRKQQALMENAVCEAQRITTFLQSTATLQRQSATITATVVRPEFHADWEE